MSTKPISKRRLSQIEKKLEKKSKEYEDIKEKQISKYQKFLWDGMKNPYDIVVDFIKEKGLKLYGGQALHEHLSRKKQGLYKKTQFPDYDVFSPNAWEHAKELANRFYKLGFEYSEAKGSILNDDVHQTYKVGVDMIYVLDMTQIGCTPEELENKDCKNGCGIDKNNKCLQIFNEIPVNDLTTYKKNKESKIYRKTYDYKKNTSIYPQKMFVCDPEWLKISMFRELTEPLTQPERLPKVGKRLAIFEHNFPTKIKTCSQKELNSPEVQKQLKPILDFIGNFVKEKKLINYGASAYNMFIKNAKHLGSMNICDYEVYSESIGDAFDINKELLEKIRKKFKSFNFNSIIQRAYWREVDYECYIISVTKGKLNNKSLITITSSPTCMPYIQINRVRYVTIDRLKFIYYRAVALNNIRQKIEYDPKNYECLLSNLLEAESIYNSKHKLSNKGKFRRFVGRCEGDEFNKIHENLEKKWTEKMKTLKKTRYMIDSPKKNYITKIYPIPSKELKLPYKPAEQEIKKHTKYYHDLSSKYSKKKSKKKNKIKTKIKTTKKNKVNRWWFWA